MEEEMDKDLITRAVVTDKDQIDPAKAEQIRELFRQGYGEKWLGDENFTEVALKNATQLLEIHIGADIAAALLFDHDRISDISVHPDFMGKGLGTKLFEEAAKARSQAWISVGTNAEGMLATVTDPALHYLPVEDKTQIEALFQETNRGKSTDYRVETTQSKASLVSERLAKKGINKSEFTTFFRHGATHGNTYTQILFQNKP